MDNIEAAVAAHQKPVLGCGPYSYVNNTLQVNTTHKSGIDIKTLPE